MTAPMKAQAGAIPLSDDFGRSLTALRDEAQRIRIGLERGVGDAAELENARALERVAEWMADLDAVSIGLAVSERRYLARVVRSFGREATRVRRQLNGSEGQHQVAVILSERIAEHADHGLAVIGAITGNGGE